MAEHLAFKDAVFRPVQKEHFCFFKQAAMRFENGGIGEISNLLSQSIVLEIFRTEKSICDQWPGNDVEGCDLAVGRKKFFERKGGQSAKCSDFNNAFRLQQFHQSGE